MQQFPQVLEIFTTRRRGTTVTVDETDEFVLAVDYTGLD
jgi:hypothetical protein